MADLGDRLIAWLTNVMMSYVSQVYRNAVCHIDEFVNGIISKINQLLNDVLSRPADVWTRDGRLELKIGTSK